MPKFKLVSFSKKIDRRFKWINLIVLGPILLWPVVFFCSAYYFHDAGHNRVSFVLFILVNLYPFYLFILLEVNARIYKRFKSVGYIIPILILCVLLYANMVIFFIPIFKNLEILNQKSKEEGYIGDCDTYRSKDNVIYFKDAITTADPKTFEYLSCNYGKDKNIAFNGKKPIEHSHAETFKVMMQDYRWQKDKYNYYYYGILVKGIDYESFEILSINYSKDKFKYYYRKEPIEDIDYDSFEIIPPFAKDKFKYYCKGAPMKGVDYNSFEILSHNYAKDKFKYYYKGTRIKGIDYNSFEILSYNYSKDKYHVYYDGRVLKNADPFLHLR